HLAMSSQLWQGFGSQLLCTRDGRFHGRQGYFSSLENMPKMIWNVFMFFGPFSVGKIGIGNFSFCVTNYVRSMENITDPKTLIKHCNFSPFLWTKEAQRTKHVHEIFKHNKCNIS